MGQADTAVGIGHVAMELAKVDTFMNGYTTKQMIPFKQNSSNTHYEVTYEPHLEEVKY